MRKSRLKHEAKPFFFSCIAGLVRDMVGQQLEWACDWDQISLKERNQQNDPKQQKPNPTEKNQNTDPNKDHNKINIKN